MSQSSKPCIPAHALYTLHASDGSVIVEFAQYVAAGRLSVHGTISLITILHTTFQP